jgi:hypothetical protein
MRHGSPETKRFYQLGLAHQVRKHLEEVNQQTYEGRPPLRFRDGVAPAEKKQPTEARN